MVSIGKLQPKPEAIGLMFTAVLILTIIGLFYNNFGGSGLNPAFALTCHGPYLPGQNVDVTCQNLNPTGCQLDPNSCTLNNTSIQFLNPNSPFTDLMRGNWLGFIYYLSGNGPGFQSQNAYQVAGFGTNNVVPGVCLNLYVANATSTFGYKPTECWQTDIKGNILPLLQALQFQPAPNSAYQVSIPMSALRVTNSSSYTLGVDQEALPCSPIASYSFGAPPAYGDILWGCEYYQTLNHKTTYWYYDVNINATGSAGNKAQQWYNKIYPGATRSFNYCNAHSGLNATQCPAFFVPVTMQPETWDVFDCSLEVLFPGGTSPGQQIGAGPPFFYTALGSPTISPQCVAMLNSLANYNASTTTTNTLGSVTLFFAGILLLIIGSGLSITISGTIFGTGGGTGIGVNRQGTKFAQVLGLGLIIWSPLYSEFSTWFSSGVLPNGLDGTTGIVSIALTITFFAGVIWQATYA